MTTAENAIRNGVDTATLFATLDAVRGDTDLAKFQFRVTNRWLSGTHNQSTIHGYRGAKQELTHREPFNFDADHPPVLVGSDNGPTPVEYLLHALAACLTAGIANVAAARGVTLTEVSSTVEGDIDLVGILGLSDHVRTARRAPAPRCSWPGSGTTWCSSTGRCSRPTRCPRTRSPDRAWSRCTGGACCRRSWPAAHRRSGKSTSLPMASQSRGP